MIIKKYLVSNMNEALTRIRHEMGKDAVIISQRKIRKSGLKGLFSEKQIEVTAAIENSAREFNDKPKVDDYADSINSLKRIMQDEIENKQNLNKTAEIKKTDNNNALKDEVKEMKELLNKVIKNTSKEEEKDELLEFIERLDIDSKFYSEFKERIGNQDVIEGIKKIIEEDFKISDDELRGNVVLVGPTGVGKTTTIAKLAGRLSLIDKKKVGLITVDTYRIGAVEQLKTYAEIMNIPFKVVITIKEMEEAIDSMKECDVILIDTTGRSSKNLMQISEMRAFVHKANPDTVNVVISATTKNKDIETILEGYKELQYDHVIVTKLDETTTYGALYNIGRKAEKPLRYITVGQNVPDDIKVPTKNEIIRFILGEESLC